MRKFAPTRDCMVDPRINRESRSAFELFAIHSSPGWPQLRLSQCVSAVGRRLQPPLVSLWSRFTLTFSTSSATQLQLHNLSIPPVAQCAAATIPCLRCPPFVDRVWLRGNQLAARVPVRNSVALARLPTQPLALNCRSRQSRLQGFSNSGFGRDGMHANLDS